MSAEKLQITDEIIDRVIYGMENQKEKLFLDINNGQLREKDTENPNDGLIPLPPWGPTEGYRLMDDFIASLPESPFKSSLFSILNSGSGVFRAFKNALKERGGMEKVWRKFKEREMRKIVISWLSRWSEALELEGLGEEPEDWDDLVITDFIFRRAEEKDISILMEWDAAAEKEVYPDFSPEERKLLMMRERGTESILDGMSFVAESPSGDLVGFSWMILDNSGGHLSGRLLQVYVLPEFRGLAIGRKLAELAINGAEKLGALTISVRTSASGKFLSSFLENNNFEPVITWWRKSRS